MAEVRRLQMPRPGAPIPLPVEDNVPKDPTYPMLVTPKNPTKEKCRECHGRKEVVTGVGGISVEAHMGPDARCPFCSGSGWVPRRVIASSAAHHSSLVGYEVGANGERAFPLPPSIEEFVRMGVPAGQAKILAAEQADKAAKGIAPYGPVPDPSSTGQNQAAGKDPLSEEF